MSSNLFAAIQVSTVVINTKKLIAASALCAFAATMQPAQADDVVGKLTVGYQGWFTAPGDGSELSKRLNWWHQPGGPGEARIDMWPDTSEYTKLYQTKYSNRPDGKPSQLFSSYDYETVDLHFRWMQQYGIDTAALQRFGSEVAPGSDVKAFRDKVTQNVQRAAEAHGRKFYIMYDLSGVPDNGVQGLKDDWNDTLVGQLKVTDSPAYAREGGKPVVCLWGVGLLKGTKAPQGGAAFYTELVDFFQGKGYYVIGGVLGQYGNQDGGFVYPYDEMEPVYSKFDMLSPWSVGRPDSLAFESMRKQLKWSKERGAAYQPVIYAGFSFNNLNKGKPRNELARRAGQFYWTHFAAAHELGINTTYVAMFDEINESTSIFKVAENASMQPAEKEDWFLPLDADGQQLSSDYYLRLTQAGARMLAGTMPYSGTPPIGNQQ